MKYKIIRPSGQVIRRFEAKSIETAANELDLQSARRGGYMELFDGDADTDMEPPFQAGGTVSPFELMRSVKDVGGKSFRRGTTGEILSITKNKVHADVVIGLIPGGSSTQRCCFSKKTFLKAAAIG